MVSVLGCCGWVLKWFCVWLLCWYGYWHSDKEEGESLREDPPKILLGPRIAELDFEILMTSRDSTRGTHSIPHVVTKFVTHSTHSCLQ